MVSADLTQEQRTGASYYTVRVLLKPEELASSDLPSWCLACRSMCSSRRRRRTALSYLIKPLTDQAERAFKER